MPGVQAVLQPLVQHHVARPALLQLTPGACPEGPKRVMSVMIRTGHRLELPGVMIKPQLKVRIRDHSGFAVEKIGESKSCRVTRGFAHVQIEPEIAPGLGDHSRACMPDELQIGKQPAQTHVVALVQRHQPAETCGPGCARENHHAVALHWVTIAQ